MSFTKFTNSLWPMYHLFYCIPINQECWEYRKKLNILFWEARTYMICLRFAHKSYFSHLSRCYTTKIKINCQSIRVLRLSRTNKNYIIYRKSYTRIENFYLYTICGMFGISIYWIIQQIFHMVDLHVVGISKNICFCKGFQMQF